MMGVGAKRALGLYRSIISYPPMYTARTAPPSRRWSRSSNSFKEKPVALSAWNSN